MTKPVLDIATGTRLAAGGHGHRPDRLRGGGSKLRIGAKAVLAVTDRDPRCKMVMLDPDTAAQDPMVLRAVNRGHEGKAGVYGAVLVEGTVRPGDEIVLAD